MEDHHVDRKRVEVWQRMKLSFTNSSFGLILSLINVHLLNAPKGALKRSCGFVLTDVPVLADLSCEPRGLTGRRALALAEQSSGTGPKPNASIRPVLKEKEHEPKGSQGQAAAARSGRAVRRLGPKARSTARTDRPVHENKLRFAGLVATAGSPHPIPSRTRP